AQLERLFATCSEEAGPKGAKARLARMLQTTSASCARVNHAKFNVQTQLLIQGVNVLSPPELDALATAVRDIVADELRVSVEPHFTNPRVNPLVLAVAEMCEVDMAIRNLDESRVSVKIHPVFFEQDAWSRPMRSLQPPRPPRGQEGRAFVPPGLPGGACSGCSVRNLQVTAVQPALGDTGTDTEGVIRIFFDEAIVVDNPTARIRLYPKAFAEVCKEIKDDSRYLYFPSDTGLGGIKAADATVDSRQTPSVPVRALCHEYTMADIVSVQAFDEVLEIAPRHPLLRNTPYVVHIEPWAVRARNPKKEERYPARWTGWEKDGTRPEYSFITGNPSSKAEISIAVGCGDDQACAIAQRLLRFSADGLADRIKCFLAWYRCVKDPSSPQVCAAPDGVSWCSPQSATWAQASQGAAQSSSLTGLSQESVGQELILRKGEPMILRSPEVEIGDGAEWVWVLSGISWILSSLSAFRAVQWFCDVYRDSREFDPYVVQATAALPYLSLAAVLALQTP
ncbi:unnamed protein product, partial [Polarella glacialis]